MQAAYYGHSLPDYQQARLYMAERRSVDRRNIRRQFYSLDEVAEFLNRKVLKSEWWAEHAPRTHWRTPTVTVCSGAAPYWKARGMFGYASSEWNKDGSFTLYLPRWAWNDSAVLHEIVHMACRRARSAHGPRFAMRRLEAQYLFGLRGTGDMLHDAFRKERVQVG